MACCKKCPCCINVEILIVVAKVQKGLIALALSSTAVIKISDVFRPFGRPVYRFGRPKNTFQVFFFQLYFNI